LRQRTCSSENQDATQVLFSSSENKDATQVLFSIGWLRNPVENKIKMLCTTTIRVIPNSGDIISQQHSQLKTATDNINGRGKNRVVNGEQTAQSEIVKDI
jgi:hypothetical protein